MSQIHPLRTFRQQQTPKLSQAGLAKMLGVNRLTILRWEGGERKIDPDRLSGVAEKTGIPAKDLRPDLIEQHEKLFGESA